MAGGRLDVSLALKHATLLACCYGVRAALSLPACMHRRGKHNQKHYTVFIAGLHAAADRDAFTPALNHEHSDAKWWSWDELVGGAAPALHPVVAKLTQEPLRKELASLLPMWETLEAEAAGGKLAEAERHSDNDDDDDEEEENDDDDDGSENRRHHHEHHEKKKKKRHHRVEKRGAGLLLV